MPNLRVRRFKQDPNCCAVAAIATLANYYNNEINYEKTKELIKKTINPDVDGLYTPEIAIFLNKIGFKSVKVITADIEQLDFAWKNISKNKLIEQLEGSLRKHIGEETREIFKLYIQFLQSSKNEIIIDYKFGEHIRREIDLGRPVFASFNWNLMFEWPKMIKDNIEPIRGYVEQHAVVIYGYTNKGVMICDGHHELYKGKLAKYQNGRYFVNWEKLHSVMGYGDLILVDDFKQIKDKLVIKHEKLVPVN